jgi:hypothetical protein
LGSYFFNLDCGKGLVGMQRTALHYCR